MSATDIRDHYNLQSLNTLSVPASARWFTEVTDESSLSAAIDFTKRHECPLLVLGSGSNVVLGEQFPGLVVKMAIAGIEVIAETDSYVDLSIGAGENWHHFVLWCIQQDYYGIENLALIPGTVGAAPIQNIGAYGVELADVFCYLNAIDIVSGKRHQLDCNDCQFGYRDSIFKQGLRDCMAITRVTLRLSKKPCWNLSYPVLKEAIAMHSEKTLSAQLIADTVIAIRQSKLPDPHKLPNAGSFFMNPLVTDDDYQRLLRRYPRMVSHPQNDNDHKLAAGWLLDNAGWRGKRVDGVGMHDRQALVLVNPHKKTGAAILAFAKSVQADIADRYGVQLQIEPRVYVNGP